MKEYHLLINPSLIDLSDLREIKQPFYTIHKKFNDMIKKSNDDSEVHKNLFSNSDNKALFYTGLENSARNSCNNKLEKVKDILKKILKINASEISKIEFVKISIESKKTKRLLSIVCKINNEFADFNPNSLFILFPIKYDDLHN